MDYTRPSPAHQHRPGRRKVDQVTRRDERRVARSIDLGRVDDDHGYASLECVVGDTLGPVFGERVVERGVREGERGLLVEQDRMVRCGDRRRARHDHDTVPASLGCDGEDVSRSLLHHLTQLRWIILLPCAWRREMRGAVAAEHRVTERLRVADVAEHAREWQAFNAIHAARLAHEADDLVSRRDEPTCDDGPDEAVGASQEHFHQTSLGMLAIRVRRSYMKITGR